MKKLGFILFTSYLYLNSYSQGTDRLNSLQEVIEEAKEDFYESFNLEKNTSFSKVTFYPLGNVVSSSIRTSSDVRRIAIDSSAVIYHWVLTQEDYSKNNTAQIGFLSLLNLQVAIGDLISDLKNIDRTENNYTDNFYIDIESGFRIGYFFEKDVQKWYYKLNKYSDRIDIGDIVWFEEELQESIDKIIYLKKNDKVLD